LEQSDKESIKIGLTGTPLLGADYNSKSLFGTYIHKYYYNASIKDGYTLRLIREEIDTSYKLKLQKALDKIEVLKGSTSKNVVYAHPKFVEPMLDYIVKDFEKARISMNNNGIGGMVVCDSADQAKMMYEIFQNNYAKNDESFNSSDIEGGESYNAKRIKDRMVNKAALILHDIGTKDDRKDLVEAFKNEKIDLLFVYNMLLTGFDAPRLKKLYIGRVIRAHNLLQALTRVNRTYKTFAYGYVVDFANIEKEFEKTNADYFRELQSELGDEIDSYSNLFKSRDEINAEINEIKNVLFHFDTKNAEIFSQQVTEIDSRPEILKITQALNNAKSLYNLIRLSGDYEMIEKLDFQQLTILAREANNRLALINLKETLDNNVDGTNLLNAALEDVIFAFIKVGEGEMLLADELKDTLKKTRERLSGNFDQQDPKFISLKEELERLFNKKNLSEVSQQEMENNIEDLNKIFSKANELERINQLLKAKYDNDEKYVRLHKRLMEKDPLTESETKLFDALSGLKLSVDDQIQKNSRMLDNEEFIARMIERLVITEFKEKQNIPMTPPLVRRVNGYLVKEYMNEYSGIAA
jgi:type I restriction enzyme R subunit